MKSTGHQDYNFDRDVLVDLYNKNKDFRAFIDSIISGHCRIMTSTFTGDPLRDAYHQGRRDLGLELASFFKLRLMLDKSVL